MDYIHLLGIAGLVTLLIGFIIEHMSKKKSRFYFNLLNFIGSCVLAAYAIMVWNIIFIILELLWAVFSLIYIIKKK